MQHPPDYEKQEREALHKIKMDCALEDEIVKPLVDAGVEIEYARRMVHEEDEVLLTYLKDWLLLPKEDQQAALIPLLARRCVELNYSFEKQSSVLVLANKNTDRYRQRAIEAEKESS